MDHGFHITAVIGTKLKKNTRVSLSSSSDTPAITCITTPRKLQEDKSETRNAWLIYSLYDSKLQNL